MKRTLSVLLVLLTMTQQVFANDAVIQKYLDDNKKKNLPMERYVIEIDDSTHHSTINNLFTQRNKIESQGVAKPADLGIYSKIGDGYLREYITIMSRFETGEASSVNFKLPVYFILNTLNQESTIDSVFPKSYIPMVNGKPAWNVDYKGISAQEMTIENLRPENAIKTNQSEASNGGRDVGPFQTNKDAYGNSNIAVGMNWINANSSRKSSPYYIPDVINKMAIDANQAKSTILE